MKEFREAKKAMERAQEEPRRMISNTEKPSINLDEEAGRSRKRARHRPDLLKAAIMNNARDRN